ncbi:MAG: phosphoribosylanthranilate isomerase [Armatimonadetes bacterium]|nr:phosphoribosylanthranilate isomerase [Armatimonadota bacterium]
MVRVKICGNTDAAQVSLCAEAGADAIGVVIEYPDPVPWNVSRQEARRLLSAAPPFVSRVAVTGGDAGRVLSIARHVRPHFLQLHTDNSPEETRFLARRLSALGIGVIRVLRIDIATGRACGGIIDPVEAALALQGTGIAALLLDARTAAMPAGTGQGVSRSLACRVREALSIPLILAGGLTPDNVSEAVAEVRPFGVDVISGVEAARGVKDPERVRQFIRRAKGTYVSPA